MAGTEDEGGFGHGIRFDEIFLFACRQQNRYPCPPGLCCKLMQVGFRIGTFIGDFSTLLYVTPFANTNPTGYLLQRGNHKAVFTLFQGGLEFLERIDIFHSCMDVLD